MKYQKTITILAAFIISFIYIIHPYIEDNILIKNPFKDEIIRFHVRANSDLEEDQTLKLKVRDEILEVMDRKFENVSTLDESRIVIENSMSEIKAIAEEVIQNNEKNYPVEVFLGMDNFPIRRYGNMIFPQGEYETLLVTIGDGQGQNWWCVMFPPLCFVDITHSVAFNAEGDLDQYIIDENQPLKLKSKIGDFFKNLKDKKDISAIN